MTKSNIIKSLILFVPQLTYHIFISCKLLKFMVTLVNYDAIINTNTYDYSIYPPLFWMTRLILP